jgi:hypothetical protein
MVNRHLTVAAGTLCAVLLLAGCAASGSGSSAAPASSSSAPSNIPGGPASDPLSSIPPSPDPTGPPSPPSVQTLTGNVDAGVEPGCLILKDSGRTYLLLGGDPAVVKAGARVKVTGKLASGVMSHCMQGLPFQVSEAHPG